MDDLQRQRPLATVTRARTGLIGLALPSLSEPYFAELTSHVLRAAAKLSCNVTVVQTEDNPQVEHDVINGRGFPTIDGILVVPRFITAADLTRRSNPLPLVLLGEHVDRSTFCHVTVDNRLAMREMTQHLIDNGRRHLVMIGRRLAPASDAAGQRELGFLEAIENVHDVSGHVVEVPGFDFLSGQRAAESVMSQYAATDGLVCVNDSIAIGVLYALHQRGVNVPTDVMVTGFDGIPVTSYSVPTLTTVVPDLSQMATRAMMLLDRQIASPLAWTPDMEQITVSHSLIMRESSGGESQH